MKNIFLILVVLLSLYSCANKPDRVAPKPGHTMNSGKEGEIAFVIEQLKTKKYGANVTPLIRKLKKLGVLVSHNSIIGDVSSDKNIDYTILNNPPTGFYWQLLRSNKRIDVICLRKDDGEYIYGYMLE